jgi:D-alanine-D-alanine ligase
MTKKKINVAVICGGPSNEREVSLRTGAQILKVLPKNKYNSRLIEITKNGRWLLKSKAERDKFLKGEIESSGENAAKAMTIIEKINNPASFDVAFIGMHGKFGEDGKIQAILETLGIPHTGSGVLASALGMNKIKTFELVAKSGVKIPKFLPLYYFPKKRDLKTLHRQVKEMVGYPCVVKPNESGSSIGITIVRNKKELVSALKLAFQEDKVVLIEEYIKGREMTCGVMGNSGRTKLVALPPLEIVPPDGRFFDYDAKYFSKETKEICPAPVNKKITEEIQKLAKKAHFVLGCDGLTRSDFILSPRNKLYFLEINTIPGLTEASLCPKEARAAGMSFGEFLDKQIELALLNTKRHRQR